MQWRHWGGREGGRTAPGDTIEGVTSESKYTIFAAEFKRTLNKPSARKAERVRSSGDCVAR